MEGIHTIKNRKLRRINPSTEMMFLQNREILFRGKGHEQSFKEENAFEVYSPSSSLTWTKVACGAA